MLLHVITIFPERKKDSLGPVIHPRYVAVKGVSINIWASHRWRTNDLQSCGLWRRI